MHVPLVVTATLPFGIAHGTPWGISLDGLLASVMWHDHKARNANAGTPVSYCPADGDVEDLDLPLARCELGDLWHWACTVSFSPTPLPDPDVRVRVRRTDHAALQRNSSFVSTNVSDTKGRYRNRSTPTLATVTRSAQWRAIGDVDRIADLLSGVAAIGKQRSCGEGLVTHWEVTPASDTSADLWSFAHEHRLGVLGRLTPLACVGDRTTRHGGTATIGVRAPYPHPSRHTKAYLPGTGD